MTAYYNENNPHAAAWLRELIREGLIAPGDVDERSICDVRAADLAGYGQCHFFAGIGGWSLALRLAGWPDDRPVWTGSCPCQPFSSAGKGLGAADPRHLAPVWLRLIEECRPPVVFGEQVAAAIAHGWLDDLLVRLEAAGYACGAAVLPAASVGAPHKRDRLWFVADSIGEGLPPRERDAVPGERWGEEGRATLQCGSSPGPWASTRWLLCRDGAARPTCPGVCPVAARLPGDVAAIVGAGNSVVPQVAAAFIGAFMETKGDQGE